MDINFFVVFTSVQTIKLATISLITASAVSLKSKVHRITTNATISPFLSLGNSVSLNVRTTTTSPRYEHVAAVSYTASTGSDVVE